MTARRTEDYVVLTRRARAQHRRLPDSPRTVCGLRVHALMSASNPRCPALVCQKCAVMDR